jgi:hypothetical protein
MGYIFPTQAKIEFIQLTTNTKFNQYPDHVFTPYLLKIHLILSFHLRLGLPSNLALLLLFPANFIIPFWSPV